MTNAISGSRRGLRTATAVGAVTLGLAALTACEKPTPLATLTVGNSDSVRAEAVCYEDGKSLSESEAKECTGKDATETIELGAGEKLRVGVEPDMAEVGWMIFSDGEPLMPELSEKTYQSIDGELVFRQQDPTGQPMPPKKSAKVSIITTEDGKVKGVWAFKVKRD